MRRLTLALAVVALLTVTSCGKRYIAIDPALEKFEKVLGPVCSQDVTEYSDHRGTAFFQWMFPRDATDIEQVSASVMVTLFHDVRGWYVDDILLKEGVLTKTFTVFLSEREFDRRAASGELGKFIEGSKR